MTEKQDKSLVWATWGKGRWGEISPRQDFGSRKMNLLVLGLWFNCSSFCKAPVQLSKGGDFWLFGKNWSLKNSKTVQTTSLWFTHEISASIHSKIPPNSQLILAKMGSAAQTSQLLWAAWARPSPASPGNLYKAVDIKHFYLSQPTFLVLI